MTLRYLEKAMLRTTIAILTICASTSLWTTGAQADSAVAPQRWCAINPADGIRGRSAEIAPEKLQIVQGPRQAAAKQRLSSAPFVKIDRDEAIQLARNPAGFSQGRNYYLVRASAFYVDENYEVKSHIVGYLYPDEEALKIVNTSLSRPGTNPVDLTIVVETDFGIRAAEIICLTAA